MRIVADTCFLVEITLGRPAAGKAGEIVQAADWVIAPDIVTAEIANVY